MFNTINQRLSTLMIIREQSNWKYLTLHSSNSLYSFIFEDKIKFQILGTQYWHFQNFISMYKDELKKKHYCSNKFWKLKRNWIYWYYKSLFNEWLRIIIENLWTLCILYPSLSRIWFKIEGLVKVSYKNKKNSI